MKTIYLAGPINGLTYVESVGWRNEFEKELNRVIWDNIEEENSYYHCLNPQRGKKDLLDNGMVISDFYTNHPLLMDKGIIARDYNDCVNASIIVVNFKDAKKVSIGTCFELAWAFEHRIPTVVIMDELHNHPFVRMTSDFVVGTIAEAVKVTLSILG